MALTETETGKKDRILKRIYRNRDGTEAEKLTDQVDAFICEVIATKQRVVCELKDLVPPDDDLPSPSMLLVAAAFGAQTTVGNAVTSVKDGDDHKRFQAMQDRWDTIKDGEWRSGVEGGPRLKYVLAAWQEVQADRQGKPCNDKQITHMRQKIIDDGTKKYLENPKIAAAYAAEEARRAIEVSKLKQAVADASTDTEDAELDVPAS